MKKLVATTLPVLNSNPVWGISDLCETEVMDRQEIVEYVRQIQ